MRLAEVHYQRADDRVRLVQVEELEERLLSELENPNYEPLGCFLYIKSHCNDLKLRRATTNVNVTVEAGSGER